MPKMKRGPRSTPPPEIIVIKEVPLVVKPPGKPKPAPAAKAEPKPHYY